MCALGWPGLKKNCAGLIFCALKYTDRPVKGVFQHNYREKVNFITDSTLLCSVTLSFLSDKW